MTSPKDPYHFAAPHKLFQASQPLQLDCGIALPEFEIAYETYGMLNAAQNNAILICHALTGDQYVASDNPVTKRPGWWKTLVGPGRAIDTDRFFVICSNVLGGCMGSTGPSSLNPATGQVWGLDFPMLTVHDMVRAQAMLLNHLGIERLCAVVGGSMGGMQALSWATQFPHKTRSVVLMATAARHSSQNIAFHEVGRQAVMADPDWCGGRYLEAGKSPARGLGVARMAAHITYMSDAALHNKFGRQLQARDAPTFSFDADFQVESYLRHQGSSFVERFDANTYLYVTRAMDYFDLAEEHGGRLAQAFMRASYEAKTRFCVVSFTSDWLFPTRDSRAIVHALNAAAASVSFVEIETEHGHDAFLLDEPELYKTVSGFLGSLHAAA